MERDLKREIKWIRCDSAQWLNMLAQQIEKLSGMGFYWNCCGHKITKDIKDLVLKKKLSYSHRMSLYNKNGRYYFVVYCKKIIFIYYLADIEYANRLDKKYSTYRYMLNKLTKYYNKGNERGQDFAQN